ncbi:hypothetical protein Tco_1208501 [Tanacetum coccineum]
MLWIYHVDFLSLLVKTLRLKRVFNPITGLDSSVLKNYYIPGLLGLNILQYLLLLVIAISMERVFLSLKGSEGGRGVKEKCGGFVDVLAKDDNGVDEVTNTSSNVAMNTQSEILSGHTINVDANVETTSLRSYPPLPTMGSTLVATSAGNAPGKSSYANVVGKL